MKIPNVIIIGDFLKDLDDEHTLCVASKLHKNGVIKLVCVVGNLKPAELRARGAKGTLKCLGLPDIPVGVGAAVFENKTYPYEADVPYLSKTSEVEPDGLALMLSFLEKCSDKSVIMVLQSGLTDAFNLLNADLSLFVRKINSAAIMGGVETSGDEVRLDGDAMIPNNANNNMFDWPSAVGFYSKMQELGIPLIITTRDAAYSCQIPFTVYDKMEATGNPIGSCLKGRQKPSLQKLWEAACSPADSDIRGTLPQDRNRKWFISIFCGNNDPGIPDDGDIWPYVGCFNLYDPINFIAAIPELRERFFEPAEIKLSNAAHLVIGVSKNRHGIKDIDALRQFLMDTEISALKVD